MIHLRGVFFLWHGFQFFKNQRAAKEAASQQGLVRVNGFVERVRFGHSEKRQVRFHQAILCPVTIGQRLGNVAVRVGACVVVWRFVVVKLGLLDSRGQLLVHALDQLALYVAGHVMRPGGHRVHGDQLGGQILQVVRPAACRAADLLELLAKFIVGVDHDLVLDRVSHQLLARLELAMLSRRQTQRTVCLVDARLDRPFAGATASNGKRHQVQAGVAPCNQIMQPSSVADDLQRGSNRKLLAWHGAPAVDPLANLANQARRAKQVVFAGRLFRLDLWLLDSAPVRVVGKRDRRTPACFPRPFDQRADSGARGRLAEAVPLLVHLPFVVRVAAG